jgi:hypothetical protein
MVAFAHEQIIFGDANVVASSFDDKRPSLSLFWTGRVGWTGGTIENGASHCPALAEKHLISWRQTQWSSAKLPGFLLSGLLRSKTLDLALLPSQEVEVVFAEVSGGKHLASLENFRTTLSGPQHLPIAKNEEAKRHDRGTLSQNEAFVACPALRANNAFTPLRSVRSAKNYNSPASSSAVETFHEETP